MDQCLINAPDYIWWALGALVVFYILVSIYGLYTFRKMQKKMME